MVIFTCLVHKRAHCCMIVKLVLERERLVEALWTFNGSLVNWKQGPCIVHGLCYHLFRSRHFVRQWSEAMLATFLTVVQTHCLCCCFCCHVRVGCISVLLQWWQLNVVVRGRGGPCSVLRGATEIHIAQARPLSGCRYQEGEGDVPMCTQINTARIIVAIQSTLLNKSCLVCSTLMGTKLYSISISMHIYTS